MKRNICWAALFTCPIVIHSTQQPSLDENNRDAKDA